MRAPRLLALGASIAVGLALTGCGGSSGSSNGGKSGKSADASLQKFRECLSEHGVKLPEGGGAPGGAGAAPPSGGKGFTPPKGGFGNGGGPGGSMFEAIKECHKYAPKGTGGPGGGGFPGGSPPSGGASSETG